MLGRLWRWLRKRNGFGREKWGEFDTAPKPVENRWLIDNTFAKLINSLDLLPSYQEVGEVDYPSPTAPLPRGEGSF